MKDQKPKTHSFEVDRSARASRRGKPRTVKQTNILEKPSGEKIRRTRVYETTLENAEVRQVVAEAAQSFVSTIEFHKSEYSGKNPHDEAVKEALRSNEWRREFVAGLLPNEVTWGHITAVGEMNIDDALALWLELFGLGGGDEKHSRS